MPVQHCVVLGASSVLDAAGAAAVAVAAAALDQLQRFLQQCAEQRTHLRTGYPTIHHGRTIGNTVNNTILAVWLLAASYHSSTAACQPYPEGLWAVSS